jgi:hypothetical protein
LQPHFIFHFHREWQKNQVRFFFATSLVEARCNAITSVGGMGMWHALLAEVSFAVFVASSAKRHYKAAVQTGTVVSVVPFYFICLCYNIGTLL